MLLCYFQSLLQTVAAFSFAKFVSFSVTYNISLRYHFTWVHGIFCKFKYKTGRGDFTQLDKSSELWNKWLTQALPGLKEWFQDSLCLCVTKDSLSPHIKEYLWGGSERVPRKRKATHNTYVWLSLNQDILKWYQWQREISMWCQFH